MNPQVHSPDSAFSVSECVWVSECARALGRATVRERLCVLSSAQSVTAGLYTAIFPLSHTHPLSPLWMTESGGLAGLSWLLFIVNIFKKASQWGRARACFWPIAESRSRWRGVRMRQWGWAFKTKQPTRGEQRRKSKLHLPTNWNQLVLNVIDNRH